MRKLLYRMKIYFVALMSRKRADRYFQSDGDVTKIVGWFLSQDGMTSRKLSAFCYLAYAWGLAVAGKEIAPFQFVKSKDGPIDPRVIKTFGLNDKPMVNLDKPELSELEERFLQGLYSKYKDTSGKEMMKELKCHLPYKCAEDKIGKQEMFFFYSCVLLQVM